jgi:hypothetical protein
MILPKRLTLRSQSLALILALWVPGLWGQTRRLWVMQQPSSIVEYDTATFAIKQSVPLPAAVFESSAALQVNAKGQMLFALSPDDPLIDASKGMADKIWFWDGQNADSLGRSFIRSTTSVGSNQRVTESLPTCSLSSSGTHLYWFTNEFNKLERDNVDLDVTTTFRAWRSDLTGKQREDLTSFEIPDCRCTTGACPETCTEARVWTPEQGTNGYFFLTRLITGQTETKYEATYLYQGGKDAWAGAPVPEPLARILDANDDASFVVSAIPDTGCCGWENQSNDQTVLYRFGKKQVIFDERERYKNPDYDVSFFTPNAKIAPDLSSVAMTISSTAKPNAPIQLSEDGQANPAESQRLRKALTEIPAVEVVSVAEGKRVAYLPHATVVGWLNDKELLIVENGVLVVLTPSSGAKKQTGIKVTDPAFAFVR